MRSFTRSDLERAARLAILKRLADPLTDPESIIRDVCRMVAEEGEPLYTRWQVERIAVRAAQLTLDHTITPREATQRAIDALDS